MSIHLIIAIFSLMGGALMLSLFLTPLARLLALRLNLVDKPGQRKIHEAAMPYGGGIAIFSAFSISIILALVSAWLNIRPPWLDQAYGELSNSTRMIDMETLFRLGVVLAGAALMFVLGLIDDRRPIRPYAKLAAQIAGGLLLYAVGIRVTLFASFWGESLLLTVLWVVAITNAVNLLDNMDGLAGGVGAICSIIFTLIAIQSGQILLAGMFAALAGSLLGFLWYNFNPARLFMGDAGALFTGYMLGALSMAGTYYEGKGPILAVAMPVVVLSIPIFDTLSVMLIRWRNGKPLMVGDTNHFSHRLVRLGMTRREAVLTIYALTAALGLSALTFYRLSEAGCAILLLHTAGILAVVGLLERAASRR